MVVRSLSIHSKSDCQELISRIQGTLSAVKPSVLGHISCYPQPFLQNDTHIFECLTPAVLSNGTKYCLLRPHLPAIRRILFNYNIAQIAGLSDTDVRTLFLHQVKPLKIPSRQKMETKLLWIRDNAKIFLQIQKRHGSVWHFIETNLGASAFNHTHGCYIHPKDDYLLKCFSKGAFKLNGVRLAICCEFFNNTGVDEFKPDVHTISFLNRVNLDRTKARVSRMPDDTRAIGITIAETLQKPRRFVDSYIWRFCAEGKGKGEGEGEGEICTEDDPKCHLCELKTRQPQLCQGFPSRTQIGTDPAGAAKRLKECNLTVLQSYTIMEKAGLTLTQIANARRDSTNREQ